MEETMNTSREDAIEMASQKKSVSFADERAPATREDNHRFAYSDEKDTQSGERIEDLERQLKS